MLTRDDVLWAYRILLGREPENEDVIRTKVNDGGSRADLVRAFIDSAEFRTRNLQAHTFFPLASSPMEVEWQATTAQMEIIVRQVSEAWHALGETKPHWSVLSTDAFLPDNIAASEQAFFETGALDLEIVLGAIRRAGRRPDEFSTVLEYGCGLGRVTHFLAREFERVIACDISASHLRLAEAAVAQRVDRPKVTFVRSEPPEFGMTERFDLWFSRIVLQHNTPPLMVLILRQALDKLRPGGLAIFQLPTYAPNYRFNVAEYLTHLPAGDAFGMHVLPQRTVFEIAARAGCTVVEVAEDDAAGTPSWRSNFFVLAKSLQV